MGAAFDALRLYARDQNIKLTDLAVTVVRSNFTPGFPRAAWDGASRSAVRRGGAPLLHPSFLRGSYCGLDPIPHLKPAQDLLDVSSPCSR